MTKLNSLLMQDSPLQCQPSLAIALGTADRAIMLQQIHYWLSRSTNIRDGHKWVYNSVHDWQKQFPWMREKTVARNLSFLEKKGILITGNYNKAKFDRTKWYRIDYEALDKISNALGQNVPTKSTNSTNAKGQKDPMQRDKSTEPIPIDYQETTNKLSTSDYSSSAKKEEDPVRESIYNQFFKLARMNDLMKGTTTNPTLDQIKQLRSLLYQCKPETLQDALLKFSDQMKADIPQQPFIYLIKMLRDGLKGEKEWEKQQ